MLRTTPTILLAAAALALGAAPNAFAGTIQGLHGGDGQGDSLTFTDLPDEPVEGNRVSMGAINATTVRIVDEGADLAPGAHCTLEAETFRAATCAMLKPSFGAVMYGSGGNDVLAVAPSLRQHLPYGGTHIEGGSGNDRLIDTELSGRLEGGEGNDIIRPGLGIDFLVGGAGNDLADYSERTVPVEVDLSKAGNDQGQEGEQDYLESMEWFIGGSAGDKITGSSKANEIDGRKGADTIKAGDGDDLIEARDKTVDTIACGAGDDTVYVDSDDVVAADCEHKQTGLSGGLPLSAGSPPPPPKDPGNPTAPPAPEPTPPGTGTEPTAPGTGAPAADTAAPSLSKLRLAPSAFRPGTGKLGTEFLFSMSEAGSVQVKVFRVTKGRTSGGKCRQATRKLRKAKRCERLVAAGSFTGKGLTAGLNAVDWTGRLQGAALPKGSYKAIVTPVDVAGNKGKAASVRLTIKRK